MASSRPIRSSAGLVVPPLPTPSRLAMRTVVVVVTAVIVAAAGATVRLVALDRAVTSVVTSVVTNVVTSVVPLALQATPIIIRVEVAIVMVVPLML